ncbi:MAG TPA: DUF2917 domain-containing protein [Nitrospiria bacterium]|nr:DUF2917 domain-containing protein [Nitrospiria bacterium]
MNARRPSENVLGRPRSGSAEPRVRIGPARQAGRESLFQRLAAWLAGMTVRMRSRRSASQAREAVVRLDSNQVWTHRVPRGLDLSVTCVRGQVWMTREGDSRDHFLRGEDTYSSREPGLVCVQAIAPAQLLVTYKRSSRSIVRVR